MMKLTFLSAGVPLTKTISPEVTLPYPIRKRMTSRTLDVTTPQELHAAIVEHAAQGHCLLTGELSREISNESRKGLVDATNPTQLLVLDIDGLPFSPTATSGSELLQEALKATNDVLLDLHSSLAATCHTVQFSASMGIKPGLRCHVFYILTTPTAPSALKAWLTHLNLTNPALKDHVRLTPAGVSLHFPLDTTSADNGRLVYIAPPVLNGVSSPFDKQYTHYVHGTQPTLDAPSIAVSYTALNTMWRDKLNELRTAAGYSKKEIKLVQKHGATVAKGAEKATVTSSREEGEFVRCNLNGGDSWGYWYHFKAPTVVYNFKDEPNYLLEELDPAHYAAARKAAQEREPIVTSPEGRSYLAFRSAASDSYWNGWFDHDEHELVLHRTRARDRLLDFLKSYGQPAPDFISDWTVELRFDLDEQFDPAKRWVNLFKPTKYLLNAKARPKATVLPTIHALIHHVLGDDDECVEHFLNWLAVIFQHRVKARTAWILSGTEGSGKGLLFEKVLTPLIGASHAMVAELPQFEDMFNAQFEPVIFLLINESEVKATKNINAIMAKVKPLITDNYIPYRAMHATAYLGRSFTNVIVASNKYDPMLLSESDRRFNVAPRQETKLQKPTAKYLDALNEELQPFLDYLMSRNADIQLAMTPLENEARKQLQFDSQTSTETVCQALRDGNIRFFIDDAPPHSAQGAITRDFNGTMVDIATTYRETLSEALLHIEANEPHKLNRAQVFALLSTTLESPPKTFNKLTSTLKHHGLHSERCRVDGELTMAYQVRWRRPEDFDELVHAWRSSHPKQQVKPQVVQYSSS